MQRTKSNIAAVVTLILVDLVLSGCSDPKKASKDNFERISATYYNDPNRQRVCMRLPGNDEVYALMFGTEPEDKNAVVVVSPSPEYVKLSLLEKQVIMSKEERQKKGAIASYRFRFTEKAKPYLGNVPGILCYANIKFLGVRGFTEPASFLGKTVSEVTLLLAYENIADWIKDNSVKDTFIGKGVDLNATREMKKTFVLMNDGWTVE